MVLSYVRVTSQYDSRRPPYWTVWWLEFISVIFASVTLFKKHFRTKMLVQMTFFNSTLWISSIFQSCSQLITHVLIFLKVLHEDWALNVTQCTLFLFLFCYVSFPGWNGARVEVAARFEIFWLIYWYVSFVSTPYRVAFFFDNDIPSDDLLLKFAVVTIWNVEYMRVPCINFKMVDSSYWREICLWEITHNANWCFYFKPNHPVKVLAVRSMKITWTTSLFCKLCIYTVTHFHGITLNFQSNRPITYHQTSNIIRTKSSNLNVSRLVFQLYLPNPLKQGVKSEMKMSLEQRRQTMNLSDQHFYCLLTCNLY